MDRSYLSDQRVVEASRSFVCVRLVTYEDAAEAEMLQHLFRGRDGLENTVFTILDPTGTKQLVRAGRSPSWVFDDEADMATRMCEIAARYPGKKKIDVDALGLPGLEDVRIGLNVGAADSQPLVIVCGEGEALAELRSRLIALAWSAPHIGRFLYATADAATDWNVIAGLDAPPQCGIVIVAPGEFGTDGTVVARTADVSPAALAATLTAAAGEHQPQSVDTRELRRRGLRAGIEWKTEVPVTDAGGRRRR